MEFSVNKITNNRSIINFFLSEAYEFTNSSSFTVAYIIRKLLECLDISARASPADFTCERTPRVFPPIPRHSVLQ